MFRKSLFTFFTLVSLSAHAVKVKPIDVQKPIVVDGNVEFSFYIDVMGYYRDTITTHLEVSIVRNSSLHNGVVLFSEVQTEKAREDKLITVQVPFAIVEEACRGLNFFSLATKEPGASKLELQTQHINCVDVGFAPRF